MNYSDAIQQDPELLPDVNNPLRLVPGSNLVACQNCDNPASAQLSISVGWRGCAACICGSAAALAEQIDKGDVIINDL